MLPASCITAVFTDLDGTAVANVPSAQASARLCRAVRAAADAGISVAAVTGRPWGKAAPLIEQMGLASPCAVAGGASIVDPATGRVLHDALLSDDQLQAVLDVAETYERELLIGDELWGSGAPARLRCRTELTGLDHRTLCLTGLDAAEADSLSRELNAIDGVSAHQTRAPRGLLVQVTSSVGTKFAGAGRLIEMLDLDPTAVVGVGDGENDLPLFDRVGHAAAIDGASGSVCAAAQLRCPVPEYDGLAQLLEHLANDPSLTSLYRRFGTSTHGR